MKKLKNQKHFLTQAVLASSLFVMPLANATPFGPGTTAGPIPTLGQPDNTVEVLGGQAATAGQIQGTSTNAVNLNSPGGIVLVDPTNVVFGESAISTIGAGTGIGINITQGNSLVMIGAGSGVTALAGGATSDGILIAAPNTTILNSGTVRSRLFSAIHLSNLGINAQITNQPGSQLITPVGGTQPTLLADPGGANLVLNNAGQIIQADGQDAIQLNIPSTSIHNLNAGFISGVSGNAINVKVSAAASTFTNDPGAIITSKTGNTLLINSDFGSINNGGEIINTGTGSAIVLNNGNVANVVAGINNFGNIQAKAPVTHAVILNKNDGTTLTNNLVNNGTIIAETPGDDAINFQTKVTHAAVIQNGGAIFGNVLLAATDGSMGPNVFIMNGGNIGGYVIANNVALNNLTINGGTLNGDLRGANGVQNVFNLNGGFVSDTVKLGNMNDKVFLAGTMVNTIDGTASGAIYHVTGGSFNLLLGADAGDVLNIDKSFSAGIINNIPTISVNNNWTVFTANNPITNLNTTLTVNKGTTLVPNSLISGAGKVDILAGGRMVVNDSPTINLLAGPNGVRNAGLVILGSNSVLTIDANNDGFTNLAGSILNIQITGITNPGAPIFHGAMVVNDPSVGARLNKGSFIQPQFTGFIPQGSIFDIIINNGGGTIVDNAFLIEPSSAVIVFDHRLNGAQNILRLITGRNSYSSLSSTMVTNGVAGALDTLAQGNGPRNPALLGLLTQLDQLSTQAQVEDAMESLAPPFNYGLIAGSYVGMNSAFNSVQLRMEDLRAMRRGEIRPVSGISLGDPANGGSAWVKGLGAWLDQSTIDGVPGYKAKAAGLAIGGDWGLNDCTTYGLAASYTKVNVNDKNDSPKDEAIQSLQLTAYGWL
ncbi:MAG: autotransporter domain-containing protein, partial [Candidatus Berkiellales bacterium]